MTSCPTSGCTKGMLFASYCVRARLRDPGFNTQDLEDKLKMSALTANDPGNNQVLNGEIGSVDWTSPVRSLDQLYAQVLLLPAVRCVVITGPESLR